DAELLGHDVAFQKAPLPAAIFLGPGHADPTLGAHLAAELFAVGLVVADLVRVEGAGVDLLRQEGAYFFAQRLAFGRQADRIEGELARHGASPSARRQHGPKPVGALGCYEVAELHGPVALVAEIIAPRP